MNHRIMVSLEEDDKEVLCYWFDLQVVWLLIIYLHSENSENSPIYACIYMLFMDMMYICLSNVYKTLLSFKWYCNFNNLGKLLCHLDSVNQSQYFKPYCLYFQHSKVHWNMPAYPTALPFFMESYINKTGLHSSLITLITGKPPRYQGKLTIIY